jgi:uncharacterized protein YdhG (YjbR/CyaY superfamily)
MFFRNTPENKYKNHQKQFTLTSSFLYFTDKTRSLEQKPQIQKQQLNNQLLRKFFMNSKSAETIDEYIATFPENAQVKLKQLRQTINEAAPDAQETISYQMPAFKQDGLLVWFAAFKGHIGFYPKASAIEAFKDKLTGFKTSKGTIQFDMDEPLPLNLVKDIVRFRLKENKTKSNLQIQKNKK